MRFIVRVVAVLVASIVYTVVFVFSGFAIWAAVTWNEPSGPANTTTVTVEPVPLWIVLLWLGGLAAVIWLVGFVLPWWRPRGR